MCWKKVKKTKKKRKETRILPKPQRVDLFVNEPPLIDSFLLRFPLQSNENGLMECPLCLAELPAEFFPIIQSCHHRSCYDCFQQYLKVEISESRVNIACPECSEPLHPNGKRALFRDIAYLLNKLCASLVKFAVCSSRFSLSCVFVISRTYTDIRMILNDQTQLEKYEDFMVRRVLAVEPDARWCPAPDCSFAVIASGCASCPKLRCERPGCDSYFCYHCKARWHPNQTCDAARAQRSQYYERSSSLSFSQGDSQYSKLTELRIIFTYCYMDCAVLFIQPMSMM